MTTKLQSLEPERLGKEKRSRWEAQIPLRRGSVLNFTSRWGLNVNWSDQVEGVMG